MNAKAAIVAIEQVFAERGARVPVMISVTFADKSGRNLSGQTVDAFWTSVRHVDPIAVGANCGLGPEETRPYLVELARIADTYTSCHPNAGHAERARRLRPDPRDDGRADARVRRGGPA